MKIHRKGNVAIHFSFRSTRVDRWAGLRGLIFKLSRWNPKTLFSWKNPQKTQETAQVTFWTEIAEIKGKYKDSEIMKTLGEKQHDFLLALQAFPTLQPLTKVKVTLKKEHRLPARTEARNTWELWVHLKNKFYFLYRCGLDLTYPCRSLDLHKVRSQIFCSV